MAGDEQDDSDDDEDCADSHLVLLSLEIAPQGLLAFDRFEQCLEIAFSKPAGAVPLDHFEEERRPILGRLGEDLEQVALLVAVGEDAQTLQVVVVGVDLADTLLEVVVVRGRSLQEAKTALLELLDSCDDVVGRQRDMLDAGATVEVEVLLDLALALALGGLVDRELDLALTFDMSAEYSVEIALSVKWMSSVIPNERS